MVRVARGAVPVVAALAAFAVLAALFFWPLWAPKAGDHMTIGLPDGDFLRQFYPYRAFVARAWGSGQIPAWNPHQHGGAPAWADPQYAVLYPWRWLQVPLATGGRGLAPWAVELEAVAHVALGAWFAFLLARRLGARAPAAVLAGLVFGFGGYLTGYPVEQLAVLDTAVWIPAALLCITAALDVAREGRRGSAIRWAMLAGAATAMSALAGHPQTAVYGAYLCAAWLAARAWSTSLRARFTASIAAVWLLFGLGLSAAQWVPTLALSLRADRALSWAELAAGLRPGDFLQLVAPPLSPAQDPAGGPAILVWVPLFVGAIALVLAVWGGVRVRASRFWLGAAVVSGALCLGGGNPLFPVLVRLVPGMALFRHQERFAVVVALSLALAAGLAFDRVMAERRFAREVGRVALTGGVVAALVAAAMVVGPALQASGRADALAFTALALGAAGVVLLAGAAGRLGGSGVAAGVLGLAALELFSVNSGRALAPHTDVWAPDALVRELEARAREGRVASEALLPGGPNAASVFSLYDVTGDNVLVPPAVGRLGAMPEIVRWRLLGVRYAVTARAFEKGAPVRELARADDRALYEVLLPAPPAWVPERVEAMDAGEMAAWRPAASFDPLAEAPVEGFDVVADGAVPSLPTERPPGEEVGLSGLEPGRATVEARLVDRGLLVLSTVFDPGWRARARERTAGAALSPPVVIAYGVLPAILLGPGDWTVEWTYRPMGLHLGMALSGATLLLGAVLWRRSREARH